ncbi:unnamed protein product [Pieris macdunnoughi]|uniref:BDBT FKBP like N-terminal domain-containing protein n=1 Tax=Pieris macdunnoughi TaxID=345717 RepID=A0A821SX17_9NEOP|nr:unnamed protein product [Pieris macdunnoughi]
MTADTVVSARWDREIHKTIITPGDYSVVPYEDSRCKLSLSKIQCKNDSGTCEIEPESTIFSPSFNGTVVIGDLDNFLDKDVELILQRMCCGESCMATIVYKNNNKELVKEISFEIHLTEVTEEQLISDWSWNRLYEASIHHKERGVLLVKEKRLVDAFRRFNKALKMLVAIEPIDPDIIAGEQVKEMIDLRVKLYNNLAHCQLQFNEYEAAIELCNLALKNDPENIKSLYRRCISLAGLKMYDEAWTDIQHVLQLDPNDKAAKLKATELKPMIEKLNEDYTNVIKKMFIS